MRLSPCRFIAMAACFWTWTDSIHKQGKYALTEDRILVSSKRTQWSALVSACLATADFSTYLRWQQREAKMSDYNTNIKQHYCSSFLPLKFLKSKHVSLINRNFLEQKTKQLSTTGNAQLLDLLLMKDI